SSDGNGHWRWVGCLRQNNSGWRVDGLLLTRNQLFTLSTLVHPVGDQLVRLRILAGRRGHDLVGPRICLDNRWWLRRARRTKHGTISEGTRSSDHRQRKHASNRDHTQAPPGLRHILIIIIVVGLLSVVLIISLLGLLRLVSLLSLLAFLGFLVPVLLIMLPVGLIGIHVRSWCTTVGLAPVALNAKLAL